MKHPQKELKTLLTLLIVSLLFSCSFTKYRLFEGYAYCSAISPDHKFLIVGERSNHIAIWNMQTHKLQKTFYVEGLRTIRSINITTDSKKIIVLDHHKLSLYDIRTGNREHYIMLPRKLCEANSTEMSRITPDGKYLLFFSRAGIERYNIPHRKLHTPIKTYYRHKWIALDPEAKYILVSTKNQIAQYDLKTGNKLKTIKFKKKTGAIALSPDKNFIAVETDWMGFFLHEWKNKNKKPIHINIGKKRSGWFYFMRFSPNNKYLIIRSSDMMVRFFDIRLKKITKSLFIGAYNEHLNLSRDCRHLIHAGNYPGTKIWKTAKRYWAK